MSPEFEVGNANANCSQDLVAFHNSASKHAIFKAVFVAGGGVKRVEPPCTQRLTSYRLHVVKCFEGSILPPPLVTLHFVCDFDSKRS